MKLLSLRFFGVTLFTVLLVLAIGISISIGWRPFIGPRSRPLTNQAFTATPARLERGQYLVEHVMGCFYCHSEHDWNAPGAPPIAAKKGAGVEWEGAPGKLYAPNITSDRETGIGAWTDDMIARAIREGVDKNGRALFPIMPYENYKIIPDEDIASIVVYLRTVPAVRNAVPAPVIDFPVNRLINNAPQPITTAVGTPDLSNQIDRGQFMTTLASCTDCHTPMERGQRLKGLEFAGGFAFHRPTGFAVSANITPDPSGISYYDEKLFLSALRHGEVGARKLNPTMPFSLYGGMTDDDLKSILAYLRTLTPVAHRVDNTEPPTPCKICHVSHGLGDRN